MTGIRRFASITAALCATLALATGCAATAPPPAPSPSDSPPPPPAAAADVRVAALNGPTAMGMAKMITDARAGTTAAADANRYDFALIAAPDEVVAKIVGGEVDIAAIPANLASVLYAKLKGDLQVLNVNTLGVLSIVGTGNSEITENPAEAGDFPSMTVKELRGKTLCAAGKGAVPEYALAYLLEKNGLDIAKDVDIQWVPEHAACLALLTENVETLAMLPQPFATAASAKIPDLAVQIDLTKAWNEVNPDSQMLTGVTVVRKAFAQEHPEAVSSFLSTYLASVNFTNNDVAAAAALIGGLKIVDAEVAEEAIPECNIVFITGTDMKKDLSGFLTVLHGVNPAAVGGALPGDDFYFGA
ncbi:MAG: ABC transporter substrate-binding protein [Propionibacteriaceae bacterium]|jgi:NitT/TauT family transport system substrate-binding protein|nr:ABC transporter substrate-binding protein [Propionibacteriaceae bacterium]